MKQSEMSRGILYILWGKYNKAELQRSIDSATNQGYDYNVAQVEDRGIHLAHKAQMFELSPFDTTLFLDTDTVVHDNLDFGFDMADRHGIACCIAPASSAHLAGKQVGMDLHPDLPQYNTGVIFFKKGLSYFVFKDWEELCEQYPRSKNNDQPAFSQAVYEHLNPYILPRTWNLRIKQRYESRVTHGTIKIIHAH